MKKLFSTTLMIIAALTVFAQGEFQFEEKNHDFGTVIEGTKAKHTFKFKNIGDAPIVISAVKASCGCTTPSYSREPIPPGGEGEITAIYNSQGRPGQFSKSIRITSNAKSPTNTVFIKGTVSKEPPRVYTAEEKAASPRLTFEKRDYNFGKVAKEQKIKKTFSVTNTGKSKLIIDRISSTCNCVTLVNGENNTIEPGKKGELSFIYSPRGINQRTDIVTIETNSIVEPKVKITFRAFVEDGSGSMLKETKSPF